MLTPRRAFRLLSVAISIFGAHASYGQEFPAKPIQVITSDPGGGSDFAARLIAQGLTRLVHQPVLVLNREGASGIIAAQLVAKAPADGYTLLLYSSGIWTLPLLQNVPYDPIKDFSPVTLAANSPNVLVVHPALPVGTAKELIALARNRPGDLNYASGGAGAPPHLAAELFKSMAHVNIVRVPYKGTGQALTALMAGQVQVMFASAALGTPHIKSGRLRPLAVGSLQPSALFPNLPTVAASGLPGFEALSPVGIFATAGTPATTIDYLNRQIVAVLRIAEVKERLFQSGVEIIGSSPGAFEVVIKADIVKFAKVIKDAGIRTE